MMVLSTLRPLRASRSSLVMLGFGGSACRKIVLTALLTVSARSAWSDLTADSTLEIISVAGMFVGVTAKFRPFFNRSNIQRVFPKDRQQRKFEKLLREKQSSVSQTRTPYVDKASGLLTCHLGPLAMPRSPCDSSESTFTQCTPQDFRCCECFRCSSFKRNLANVVEFCLTETKLPS